MYGSVAGVYLLKTVRKISADTVLLPAEPVSIRTVKADEPDAIAFVNHNIDTVVGQLSAAGLSLVDKLSVSNLRSERLKKVLPQRLMLAAEKAAQRRLAARDFGPSIFLELRRD